jgi:hypothetical protein
MTEKNMAPVHFLSPTTFDMNSINPNIVTPNPKGFKTNGKAKRAIKVERRFFQLISEDKKAGLSFSSFLRLERTKLTNERKPKSDAARKERRPEPAFEKVPREALSEETSITTAKMRKKTLLF